jgi:hypothetical protein
MAAAVLVAAAALFAQAVPAAEAGVRGGAAALQAEDLPVIYAEEVVVYAEAPSALANR